MTPAEIKQARIKLGYTQKAFGEVMRRDIATVRSWETDPAKTSHHAAPKWAVAKIQRLLGEMK